MAQEDLDLIIHLGDYIYEYGPKAKQVRYHIGPECETLDEYRLRYAQYRCDENLQTAHAHVPLAGYLGRSRVRQQLRRRGVRRAGCRHGQVPRAPCAEPTRHIMKTCRSAGPSFRTGRTPACIDARDFGRLAGFAVLDTRQYRTDQPNGDGNKPPGTAVYDPKATLLGAEQEQWLYSTLRSSPSRWNVLAQQVMMARVDRVPGEWWPTAWISGRATSRTGSAC